tara:strand:+ start:379 stop:552 length:174 start_codon:yes stop_codon:yes gene_type:complete
MKGVAHYKKDGTLYKGKGTHKDAKGKLMSGKTHTASSKYLFHMKELPKAVQAKLKKK